MPNRAGKADQREFAIGPEPEWVTEQPWAPDWEPPLADGEDGVLYLLVDNQTRVEESSSETFVRRVLKVVNLVGVESVSQQRISFDPSYEDLTLHAVEIHRDGERLDRPDPQAVAVLQRGSGWGSQPTT